MFRRAPGAPHGVFLSEDAFDSGASKDVKIAA
jgi:hypothetical protein